MKAFQKVTKHPAFRKFIDTDRYLPSIAKDTFYETTQENAENILQNGMLNKNVK